MTQARRSAVLNYGFAFVLALIAVAITFATPLRAHSPYLVPVVAVLLSARYGWGPGLLATLVGTIASASLFRPVDVTTGTAFLVLIAFASVGIGATWLTVALSRAKEYARMQAAHQAAVARLGQQALASKDLDKLLDQATQLVCDILGVEYCKVMELEPDGQSLLLKAGHGWREGAVGHARISAGAESQAGFTLLSNEPLIVDDVSTEKRFTSSPLLTEHGVVSGMSVIIGGRENPFGILGAHTSHRRSFSQDDVHLLQSVANVLAMAVERARDEEQVRASGEQYRTIADTARDGMVTVGEDNTIVLVNPALEDIFGYSRDELVGQKLDVIIPGERRERQSESTPRPPASGERRQPWRGIEQPGVHKSGRTIPLEVSFGEYVKEGIHYLTGIVRDVTERKAAEDQLRFQAEILRNVRDSVIVTDRDGIIRFWNEGATAIFGYAAEEMMGTDVARLYPEQSTQLAEQDLARIQGGADYAGEWKGRRRDGSTVWVNIKTTVMRDSVGKPAGFIGVATDVTARKQSEDRLRAQYAVTQALAEAETISQATPRILEAICDCTGWDAGVIWSLDREAEVLRCLDVWRAPEVEIREFESLTREMLFLRDVGLPGQVWDRCQTVWVQDIAADPGFPRGRLALKNGLRAAVGFPIVTGGEFTGVIEFYGKSARQPDQGLTQMMDALTSQIGQFIKRKQAEEALRLSEEQQSVILQGVADGITAQDPTGRLVFANRGAALQLGFESPEQLMSTPLSQIMSRFLMTDEKGEPLASDLLPGRVALREKRPASRLVRFHDRETEEERWSQVNAMPVLDERRRIRFAINIFHDVTEQRRVEQAVREQRELLRVTLASIGDAVISTDTRGRVTFMNPVAEALTGWAADDAIDRPLQQVFDIVSEETNLPVANPAARVMQEQRVVGLANHTLLMAKDGRHIPVDDSAAPIRDSEGNIIGIVLVFRDVTERRRTERDVSRLAAIVKSSEDAIVSKTLDGTILTWNPAAEKLFGYRAQDAIGKPITLIYPPERLQEFEWIMSHLRRGEAIDHFDTVRVTKDGRRVDVSLSVSLIRDAAGHVLGASKIVRDITERKRAEQAAHFLAEASDELASSLDYETTLASVARLAVPQIADWCAVDVKTEDGSVRRLALAHVDPAKGELAQEIIQRFPSDPNAPTGVYNVLRTGKPEMMTKIPEETIARSAQGVEHLKMLLELGLKSYMVVPMVARGRILGAISFILSDTSRSYGVADLDLAQDLARRAALAVDNARLYREAQTLNEELEQRVIRRTIELQNTNRKLEAEVAKRQTMNNQLRLLSGHLQSAREEERISIAREIHDEIGQVLTAVKMDLSLLEREIQVNGSLSRDKIREEMRETTQLVDGAIQTMHNIVRELRPEVLDHLGLRAALEWQMQEFQARTRIRGVFRSDLDDVELDTDRSTAVFRIFQETLTNIVRHAQATEVEACLKKQDHELILEVKDNGKGISDEALGNASTFGLLGMRERAHVFGGEVFFLGEPGTGTTVTTRIPL